MNDRDNEEITYISMEPAENWRVVGVKDLYAFLGHLGLLFPEDAILYIEGSALSKGMSSFYSQRSVEDSVRVGVDAKKLSLEGITIGPLDPRYQRYRIRLTKDNVEALAREIEHNATPEIADGIYVYRGKTVLMEGPDWDYGTYYISTSIAENRLQALCQQLGCQYERSRDFVVDDWQE